MRWLYKNLALPLLRMFDPEAVHDRVLLAASDTPLFGYGPQEWPSAPKIHGQIPRRSVGVAAGMDKNGEYLRLWEAMGASFVEVGTVTLAAQMGHPRPRIWREKEGHLRNKMGFPNQGIHSVLENINFAHYRGATIPYGLSVSKNAKTPEEETASEIGKCLGTVAWYIEHQALKGPAYIAINISSPNTEGLRKSQTSGFVKDVFQMAKDYQFPSDIPIYFKLSPALDISEVSDIAVAAMEQKGWRSGLILSNTVPLTNRGGQSGPSLFWPNLVRVETLAASLLGGLKEDFPIIAVGGISKPEDVLLYLKKGASACQLYTGLINYGPTFFKDTAEFLAQAKRSES